MRALLLDLDDTLLDYSGGVDASWAEACREACAGRDVVAEPLLAALAESRRWFWSDPVRHRRERIDMLGAWRKIVEDAMARAGIEVAGLAGAIAAGYRQRRQATMRLFPDALATLEGFHARGVALALVTNGDAREQREKIERHCLHRFFAAIVIEGEFGAGKPEPVVFRHVLRRLGVTPHEAAMVGDRLEFDVSGSQAAGIPGIWLDRAGLGLPPDSAVRPDHVVRSLSELLRLPHREASDSVGVGRTR